MKRWWLVFITILIIVLLFSSCTRPSTPAPPAVDWSRINIPSMGEEGTWVLAPDVTAGVMTPVFSSDGKTIYGLISNEDVFLVKSDDGGYTWTKLSGLDGLGLMEAFNIVALRNNLFVSSLRKGIYRSTNGGKTWERILTSSLKLRADGKEIQVGPLESVTLSDNFAQDNTIFVHEGGDKPRVWISTDGGTTFIVSR